MDQDEIKLYVCEDGAWSLAERYGGSEGDKAVGEAKLSLRAAGVQAVKVVHSHMVDRQQKHDSLYRVVKAGAKPPPDPDPGQAPPKVVKSAAAARPKSGGAAPVGRVSVLPPISTLTAPKPQAQKPPPRKKIPTGQRIAMASASGSVAAVAGPVLMSSNIAADAISGTAGSYMVYLTAIALFLATFSTVLYVTGRIGEDPEARQRKKKRKEAKGEAGAVPPSLAMPAMNFEEAMGMALDAKAEPFAITAAALPDEEEAPEGAAAEIAQNKKRLLEFLQQCLTEAASKKYLPRGQMDAKARFGFHLFMLGAGQACLAALPQSLKIKLADLVESALTTLGSDAAKARAFAEGIDSYRGDAKHAAMIRAGTDAMAGFLKDNKLAGSVLSEALKIWNMVDREGALGADAGSQDVAIMFTDMVSSVETTQQIGDEGMMKLVEQHNLIVGAVLKQHRGHQVKHTGDGVMAVFPRVADGVTAAAEIQRQIAEFNAVTVGAQLKIRIGLSAGNPIRKDDDYFGTVVQTAARVCPVAGTGEIALPEAMIHLPGCDRFIYSEPIPVPLKGFSTPQLVRKLLWSAGAAPAATQARAPEPADAG
jgi:adenylate cyclase